MLPLSSLILPRAHKLSGFLYPLEKLLLDSNGNRGNSQRPGSPPRSLSARLAPVCLPCCCAAPPPRAGAEPGPGELGRG